MQARWSQLARTPLLQEEGHDGSQHCQDMDAISKNQDSKDAPMSRTRSGLPWDTTDASTDGRGAERFGVTRQQGRERGHDWPLAVRAGEWH